MNNATWAKRSADMRVEAPGQARKRAMLGVLYAPSNELTVITSETKQCTNFNIPLEALDRRCAPCPASVAKPTVIARDNSPIRSSKLSTKALAARPWLTVDRSPRYAAPDLNDIKRRWCDLKRHHLANRTSARSTTATLNIHMPVHDNEPRTGQTSCVTIYEAQLSSTTGNNASICPYRGPSR